MSGKYDDRIVRLLQLYMVGEITDEERRELEVWCGKDIRNQRFFEKVCREEIFGKEIPSYQKINEEKAFRYFERQTGATRQKGERWHIGGWWKYVAVLLFPILIVGIWKWVQPEEKVTIAEQVPACIHPGVPQAVLLLDDGQRVVLKEKEEGEIAIAGKTRVVREKGRLVYTSGVDEETVVTRYNQLEVPRGGEYKVTLADGTMVYLNSATRLKYPVAFDEKERKVYLSGEAYFEVAKDAKRPFLVEVGDVEVKVYGTSFNVNSYREGNVQTVLVEGSVGVRVLASGEESIIKPGQMAEFKQEDAKVDVREVNVAVYTDWKDGIFRFENQRLEDILGTLAKWYEIDVFYQTPSVKDLHFSGYMERYKEINTILEAINLATGVRFSIQGTTVIVSK